MYSFATSYTVKKIHPLFRPGKFFGTEMHEMNETYSNKLNL